MSLYVNRNCYQEAKDTITGAEDGVVYYGQAEHGKKTDEAVWRIWIEKTVEGVTYATFPDVASDEQCFRFIWDSKAELTFFDPTI